MRTNARVTLASTARNGDTVNRNFEQKEALIPIILEPRMSSFLSFLINALAYKFFFLYSFSVSLADVNS